MGCALEIYVNGLIEIIMKQTIGTYEKVSYYFSIAVLLVTFWFCHKIVSVYRNHKYKMHDSDKFPIFNNRWGVIWEEINKRDQD